MMSPSVQRQAQVRSSPQRMSMRGRPVCPAGQKQLAKLQGQRGAWHRSRRLRASRGVRAPSFIIACGTGTASARFQRAHRAISVRRPRQVRLRFCFPSTRRRQAFRRRRINRVVQPAEPFGGNAACIIVTGIGNPTAMVPGRLHLFRLIIDVALGVFADADTAGLGVEPGAEGLTFPPCEDVLENAHGRAVTTLQRAMQRALVGPAHLIAFGNAKFRCTATGDFQHGRNGFPRINRFQ